MAATKKMPSKQMPPKKGVPMPMKGGKKPCERPASATTQTPTPTGFHKEGRRQWQTHD